MSFRVVRSVTCSRWRPIARPALLVFVTGLFVLISFVFISLMAMPFVVARDRPRLAVATPDPARDAGPAGREDGGAGAERSSRRLAGPVNAAVVAVIDGDTVEVRALVWIQQEVVTRVRLRGIDAPELAGRCPAETRRGTEARDALAGLVTGTMVRLTEIEPDKYGGRVVARVILADGREAGEALVALSLARPYAGKRRQSWCG